jgi:hypothetical protein
MQSGPLSLLSGQGLVVIGIKGRYCAYWRSTASRFMTLTVACMISARNSPNPSESQLGSLGESLLILVLSGMLSPVSVLAIHLTRHVKVAIPVILNHIPHYSQVYSTRHFASYVQTYLRHQGTTSILSPFWTRLAPWRPSNSDFLGVYALPLRGLLPDSDDTVVV